MGLLVLAVTGFAYAYRQNKRSRQHLQQMISNMEALSQAEKTLQEMQTKLLNLPLSLLSMFEHAFWYPTVVAMVRITTTKVIAAWLAIVELLIVRALSPFVISPLL